jgi:hypothetical protein
LSSEVAFIGVIKQDDKVIGELTKVTIPTTMPDEARFNYGYQAYSMAPRGGMLARGGRGGFRGGHHGIMQKSAAVMRSRAAVAPTMAYAAPQMNAGYPMH